MNFLKKAASFMTAAVLSLSIFGAVGIESTVSEAAANTTIVNDTFWKDTNGNNIYSQGGGIFKFGDTYYWYGVHYKGAETYAASPSKKNDDTGFVSVTCYSSKDLVNWKFENDVLTTNSKGMNWCYWFGRLGVAYCKKTKQYVLIAQHNEDVMFAQCSTPTGNFEVKNYQNQIDGVTKAGTGDQTVFTDDDGNSYIICSNKGGRGHQYVVPLSDDYLSAGKAVEVAKGSGREGNCMFKYKGKYYFCASDLHGWNASHSYYMVADNIMGPYSSWKVMPGTDEDFSHVTQTGFFYTVNGSKQETVLFCGDRWSDFAGNGLGYNQWVPLSFNGSEPYFNSLSEWNLNDDTGEWSVGAGNNYILNPSFEADRVSQTTLAGWKASETGNSNKNSAHIGRWSAQQWSDSAYKATLTQDITLPNGTYTMKFWVRSTGGQNSCKVYLTSDGKEYNVSVNKSISSWQEMTINDIQITNGKCQVGIYSDANAGNYVFVDDFSLVRSDGTAPPISQPDPIPDGKYIKSLTVNDVDNYADWSIQQNLQVGSEVFGDRAFKFKEIPEALKGAEFIRTACDSKKFTDNEASFTAGEDMTAYVGLDSRITETPAWLSDWTKTDLVMTDDGATTVTYNIYKCNFSKNDTVTLGAVNNGSVVNYVVMAEEQELDPIPDGHYIKSLTVNDRTNYNSWSVQQNLQVGSQVFGDRTFKFTEIPDALKGAEFIRTACDSKKFADSQASFIAGQDMTVYVGLDNRITDVPAWLNDWVKTDKIVRIDGDPEVTLNLYKTNVAKGDTITLGIEGVANSVNYIVAATIQENEKIIGDVTADGEFDISDVVTLQKWLLAAPDTKLADWKAADLCEDGRLDVFDLCLMKRLLINQK
ncbi:MAG: family 43 glycosylhydrolase [Alistipes sp.]|nr:family 43 glycosylhydrolase [Alistipes sp.]